MAEIEPPAPMEPEQYSVMGETVLLQPHPRVFSPSSHGLAFGNFIDVREGETFVDIGCGSGVYAIAGALRGAIVTAIDPNTDALRATQKNAALNGVSVVTVQGTNFAGLRRQFDVIAANLPQDIIHPDTMEELEVYEQLAICGGNDGDDPIRQFLDVAPKHMHKNSRLYTLVYTGARHDRTEELIDEKYDVESKHTSTVECKPHVARHIEFYKQLMKQGIITIFRRRGKWCAHQHEYALRKK